MATKTNNFDTLNDCISIHHEDPKPLPPRSAPTAGKDMVAKKAGKTSAKKRTWKKPKGKPKRPLSAYNLFFQDEREKIVAAVASSDACLTKSDDKTTNAKQATRKPRGKIGFANLARNIAAKWKVLDESSKCLYEVRAKSDKERYTAELIVWNEKQKLNTDKGRDGDFANPKCDTRTLSALSHRSSHLQPPPPSMICNESIELTALPSVNEGMIMQNYPVREGRQSYMSSDISHRNPYVTYVGNDHANHHHSLKAQRTDSDDLINILDSASKMSHGTLAHGPFQSHDNNLTNQQTGRIYTQDACGTRGNSFSGIWGNAEPSMHLPNYLAHSTESKLLTQPPSQIGELPTMQPPLPGQHQQITQDPAPDETNLDPGLVQQVKPLTLGRTYQPPLTLKRQIAEERYTPSSSGGSNNRNQIPPSAADKNQIPPSAADNFQDDFIKMLSMISSDKFK